MFKKTVLSLLGLAILALLIFALLKLASHPATEKARESFKDGFVRGLSNLGKSSSPERRPPLSTLELEGNLQAYLQVPFESFSQEDWEWFWNLLYGSIEEGTGTWSKRGRQLGREEIQEELAYVYPQPFSIFGDQQWAIFWQQILKGKVFK